MSIKNFVAIPLALLVSLAAYVVFFAQNLLSTTGEGGGARIASSDAGQCATTEGTSVKNEDDHMLFISCGGFLE